MQRISRDFRLGNWSFSIPRTSISIKCIKSPYFPPVYPHFLCMAKDSTRGKAPHRLLAAAVAAVAQPQRSLRTVFVPLFCKHLPVCPSNTFLHAILRPQNVARMSQKAKLWSLQVEPEVFFWSMSVCRTCFSFWVDKVLSKASHIRFLLSTRITHVETMMRIGAQLLSRTP